MEEVSRAKAKDADNKDEESSEKKQTGGQKKIESVIEDFYE